MGGGTTQSESSSSQRTIPKWLKPLLKHTAAGWEAAQGAVPSLAQLYQNVPRLNIPGLTPDQLNIISGLQGLGQSAFGYLGGFNPGNVQPNPNPGDPMTTNSGVIGGPIASNPGNVQPNPNPGDRMTTNYDPGSVGGNMAISAQPGAGVLTPEQQAASAALQSFLGSPGQPSSATQAALAEFNQLQAPAILQQAAMMGLGNSPAALDALSRGQTSALVPFMQQDLANTLGAAGQLGNIGAQTFQQAQQEISNALEAAGMPREVALQQAQALYDQLANQFNLAQQIQMGPANLFGNLFGSQSTVHSTTTPSKF
jgi:hypothetical protein